MKIKVLNTDRQLLNIKDDWNALYEEGSYSVFQSFDFCYESSIGKSIFIICLIDGIKIIEIWPCEIINRKLRFINDTHADFCDIITSSKSSDAIANYLKEINLHGSLRFKNIKSCSFVKSKLSMFDFYYLSNSISYSVLHLDKTIAFPSNFHHFVNRQKRRLKRILNKYSGNLILYNTSNSKFPISDIIKLKDKMIFLKYRNTNFLDKSFLRLSESLFNSGKLIVSKLVLDNEVVALSLLFKSGNNYSFWVDMYNDLKMINIYHNTLFIKNMTQSSNASFNFGRGVYNYKIQNFSPEILPLEEISVFNSYFEKICFQFYKYLNFRIIKFYKKLKFNFL